MSVNSKMTALANEIRELSGVTDKMGLNDMKNHVGEANTDVATEAELIEQISTILQNKATGSAENEDGIITGTISSYFNDRVTDIKPYAFNQCYSLTTVNFPQVTYIGSNAFCYCTSLATASFPQAKTIYTEAFLNCYNLKSLYLTGSSLCTLSNSDAFTSTPIGGYSASAGTYGSIYVPASLLTSYQTATNWTYFSSRFVAFDDNGSDLPNGSVSCSPYIFVSVNGQPVSEDVIVCEDNGGDGIYTFTYNGTQSDVSWNFNTQDGSEADYEIVEKKKFSWIIRFPKEPSPSNIIYVDLVFN